MRLPLIKLAIAGVLALAIGVTLGVVSAHSPEPADLDHFLLYKAKASERETVTIENQFTTSELRFRVRELRELGVPVDKDGGGITDDVTHLTSYRVTGTRGSNPSLKINKLIHNQFGEIVVKVRRADRLMVPASKNPGSRDPIPLASNDVDDYLCYRVTVRDRFSRFRVDIEDQFTGEVKTIRVKKPTRLCVPTNKESGGIKNPDTHLMCYSVGLVRGELKNDRVSTVTVNDQFDNDRTLRRSKINVRKPRELCVPSEKTPGGDTGYGP